jgi:uncharacterized protein
MRRSFALAVILVLAAAAAVLLAGIGRAPAAARGDAATPSSITTSGHGIVTQAPDRATVTAGVETQAATASAALAENAQLATAVVAALRAAGGSDLQTQQVSLYPRTDSGGQVVGYTADDTISATSPVAGAGRLVDAAVAAGANTISGPSLDLSARDALYREALGKAVADARAKAEEIAKAGGLALGAVTAVVEGQAAGSPVPFAADSARSAATPVEPGSEDVTADVTVTFGVR